MKLIKYIILLLIATLLIVLPLISYYYKWDYLIVIYIAESIIVFAIAIHLFDVWFNSKLKTKV